jgi:hypothetical protein
MPATASAPAGQLCVLDGGRRGSLQRRGVGACGKSKRRHAQSAGDGTHSHKVFESHDDSPLPILDDRKIRSSRTRQNLDSRAMNELSPGSAGYVRVLIMKIVNLLQV